MIACCYCIGSGHPEYTDPECCLCLAQSGGYLDMTCDRGRTRQWRHFAALLIRDFTPRLPYDPWAEVPF